MGQPFCVSNSAFANKGFRDVSLAISAQKLGIVLTDEGPRGRFPLPQLHLSYTELGALTRRQRWLLQQKT